MTVGERIRKMRKERGITQVQLSKMTGISQSSISDLEKLTNNPSTVTLQLIAKALNCSVSVLLGEDEKKPATNGDGLRDEVVSLLLDLSDDDLQEMRNYAAYLKSRREKE